MTIIKQTPLVQAATTLGELVKVLEEIRNHVPKSASYKVIGERVIDLLELYAPFVLGGTTTLGYKQLQELEDGEDATDAVLILHRLAKGRNDFTKSKARLFERLEQLHSTLDLVLDAAICDIELYALESGYDVTVEVRRTLSAHYASAVRILIEDNETGKQLVAHNASELDATIKALNPMMDDTKAIELIEAEKPSIGNEEAICIRFHGIRDGWDFWLDAESIALHEGCLRTFLIEECEIDERKADEILNHDWQVVDDEGGLIGEFTSYNCFGTVDWKGYCEAREAIENCGMDEEAFKAGLTLGFAPDVISDRYYGSFESDEDFAEDYVESTGLLAEVPEHLKFYFDMERYARDLTMDFAQEGTHYFYNH